MYGREIAVGVMCREISADSRDWDRMGGGTLRRVAK
jgi:hypothetical protein